MLTLSYLQFNKKIESMKLSLVLWLFLVPLLGFSQKADPPMVVQQTMIAKYQGAKKVQWEQEGDSIWEVEFIWEGIRYEVNYDNEGNRIQTEHELTDSEIPHNLLECLNKSYPDYEIEEAWWVETSQGIFYEFELEAKDGEVEVLMNSECSIIPEDDKDDEAEDNE